MMGAHVTAAWIGIACGLLSGTVQGLFFHAEGWLGGYGSWRRRMLRLGHISFFGIAFLNLAYAQTLFLTGPGSNSIAASWLLLGSALGMPAVCYLAAWKKALRHLFAVPSSRCGSRPRWSPFVEDSHENRIDCDERPAGL